MRAELLTEHVEMLCTRAEGLSTVEIRRLKDASIHRQADPEEYDTAL